VANVFDVGSDTATTRRLKRELQKLPKLRGLDKSPSEKDLSSPAAKASVVLASPQGDAAGKNQRQASLAVSADVLESRQLLRKSLQQSTSGEELQTCTVLATPVKPRTAPCFGTSVKPLKLQGLVLPAAGALPESVPGEPPPPKCPPRLAMNVVKSSEPKRFAATQPAGFGREQAMNELNRSLNRPLTCGARQSASASEGQAPHKLKEATICFHKVVRAQEQLAELLDTFGETVGSEEQCRVSDESAKLFNCFMQGYARNVPAAAVETCVGEVEVDRSYTPSTRRIGEHYMYFTTRVPSSEQIGGAASLDEHASRLERARALLVRDRVIINSRKIAKSSSQKGKRRAQPTNEMGGDDDRLAYTSTCNRSGNTSACTTPKAGRSRRGTMTLAALEEPGGEEGISDRIGLITSMSTQKDEPPPDSPRAGGQMPGSSSCSDNASHSCSESRGGSSQLPPLHKESAQLQAHKLVAMPTPAREAKPDEPKLKCKEAERPVVKGRGKGKSNKRQEAHNSRMNQSSQAATLALKAEMRTREACESLRILVFGTEGTISRGKEFGAFYEQRCGTKDEIMQLFAIWNQMDEDGSGDVEFSEFMSFFGRSKADRLLGMRCVKYLVGQLKECEDENEPDGCVIEDMMKLIYLKATDADIAKMLQWFREAEFQGDRLPTPPLLPKRKRREVLENFPVIDKQREGITFEELVDSGLVDESIAKDLRLQHDRYNCNRIDEPLLLEMLCPNGYRAHRSVKTCSDATGQPLIHVSSGFYTGWVPASKGFKWDLQEASKAFGTAEGASLSDIA